MADGRLPSNVFCSFVINEINEKWLPKNPEEYPKNPEEYPKNPEEVAEDSRRGFRVRVWDGVCVCVCVCVEGNKGNKGNKGTEDGRRIAT